mmetsp:Transcript_87673/g.203966  ORF Transcript_87673/g.203966 Transcript_87673/m.203966 type:complete len:300 (-) Transcript_87673:355-1254(-)
MEGKGWSHHTTPLRRVHEVRLLRKHQSAHSRCNGCELIGFGTVELHIGPLSLLVLADGIGLAARVSACRARRPVAGQAALALLQAILHARRVRDDLADILRRLCHLRVHPRLPLLESAVAGGDVDFFAIDDTVLGPALKELTTAASHAHTGVTHEARGDPNGWVNWVVLRLALVAILLADATLPLAAKAEGACHQMGLSAVHVLELREAAVEGATTTYAGHAAEVLAGALERPDRLREEVVVHVGEDRHRADHDNDHDALLLGLLVKGVDDPAVVDDLARDVQVVRAVLHACLHHTLAT